MEQITSLTITKISPRYWKYVSNLNPQGGGASAYTGTALGNFITTKTLTGGVLLKDVQWNVINYIDNLDPTKNMNGADVTVDELMAHLVEENFYVSVDVVGSVSGVNAFKQLLDTFDSFTGRNGQILYVNETTGKIASKIDSAKTIKLQDLVNYLVSPGGIEYPDGKYLPPNKLLMTSSQIDSSSESNSAAGFVTVDPVDYYNRPALFTERKILHKGYGWQDNTIVGNEEIYAAEVGDLLGGWFYFEPNDAYPFGQMRYIVARWNGGDQSDINNYSIGPDNAMPFPTDPDKEED